MMSDLALGLQSGITSAYDLVAARSLDTVGHIGKIRVTALHTLKVSSLLFDARHTVDGSPQSKFLHAVYDEFDTATMVDIKSTLLDLSIRLGHVELSEMLAGVHIRLLSTLNTLWEEPADHRRVYVWGVSNWVLHSQRRMVGGWDATPLYELDGADSWTWSLQGDVPSTRELQPQDRSRLSDDWDVCLAPGESLFWHRVAPFVLGLLKRVGLEVLQDVNMRSKARLLEIALLLSDVGSVVLLSPIVPCEHRLLRIWTFQDVFCLWRLHHNFGYAADAIRMDLSHLLLRRVEVMREQVVVEPTPLHRFRVLRSFAGFSLFDAAVLLGDRAMATEVVICNARTLALQLHDITFKFSETNDCLERIYFHVSFPGRFTWATTPLADPVHRAGALLEAVQTDMEECCGFLMLLHLLSAIGPQDDLLPPGVIRLITCFASSMPVNVWQIYSELMLQLCS